MNCKICGHPADKPRIMIPGKFAWCSQACWKKEGEKIVQAVKDHAFKREWDPRRLVKPR